MPPLPPPQPPKQKRGLVLGLVVALVIAVALIVALVVGGDDSDKGVSAGDSATIPASTALGGVVPGETQPVEVTGEALPPLPDPGDDDAALGVVPPTLDGYSFDGSAITIEPTGKPTMVVFVAHWCPHCNREIPRLLEWKASGTMPEGLDIVGVSTGVRSDGPNYPPSTWLETLAWPWPVMADSDDGVAAQAYGLTGFPYFALIGADGTVKVRFSGEIEIDQLDSLVRAALAD